MNETNGLVIPRTATIRQTAQLGIMSIYGLRLRLAQGTLPGFYSGSRFYVNLDKLLSEMNGEGTEVKGK